jgi:hypothetical protein
MNIDDEKLMAFVDGELSASETAEIQSAIVRDPALAQRVERIRSVRSALRAAYDPVAEEPVPQRLLALLGERADEEAEPTPVASIAEARERRARSRFGPPAWAAMAASLVVGLLAGRMIAPGGALIEGDDSRIYAGAALARVLDTGLASDAENATRATRVGLSFRTRDARLCRTFVSADDDSAVSGLACRDSGRWAVQVAVQERGEAGAYRQAASVSPAVLEMVDALIEGEPLDADEERSARDSGWRS